MVKDCISFFLLGVSSVIRALEKDVLLKLVKAQREKKTPHAQTYITQKIPCLVTCNVIHNLYVGKHNGKLFS